MKLDKNTIMKEHSDQFVLSQYNYYKSRMLSGNAYDRMMIQGLYDAFKSEAIKRGLILFIHM